MWLYLPLERKAGTAWSLALWQKCTVYGRLCVCSSACCFLSPCSTHWVFPEEKPGFICLTAMNAQRDEWWQLSAFMSPLLVSSLSHMGHRAGFLLSQCEALWCWRMSLHFRCAMDISIILPFLSSKFLSKGSSPPHWSLWSQCSMFFFPLPFPQKLDAFCDIFSPPRFCPHRVSTH